jgi:transposase InsO family protein
VRLPFFSGDLLEYVDLELTVSDHQVRKIQVDNGTEFPLLFALTCQDLGVRVRHIRPRRPQQNGKVERSHRIDDEEFWGRYADYDFDAAHEALAAWEYRYNHERFSMPLRGRTPMEKLAARLAPGPADRHRTRPGQRPVSEHALLICQGGRAPRTGARKNDDDSGA